MRILNRLTAVQVARAKTAGLYSDGGNLYLQITKAMNKSWLFRYMRNGKMRGMGLGPVHTISLAEARAKAQDCRRMLLDGLDPLEVKRAKQRAEHEQRQRTKSLPFRECARLYIEAHRTSWKNGKHAAQWESTMESYVNPLLGNHLVSVIDTDEIMKVLEPIWVLKTETATRIRGRMESILAWATVRGYRNGLNPARWKGHLDQLLPKPSRVRKFKHHPALPYAEAPDFMQKLRCQEGNAALALQFTILTASRTNEVIGARRREFDLPKKVWTVPAERMKAQREHRIPLSTAAAELAAVLLSRGTSEFLLPGNKEGNHLSNMAMLQLLKRMGRKDLTVHGFRSTFKDWARETTHYAKEVSEAALAHIVGDETEAAYARGDLFGKRASLMQDWADYLLRNSS